MEEDDDDFYGGGASTEDHFTPAIKNEDSMAVDQMNDSAEEDDSDDDEVQFTLEKPEGVKEESSAPSARKQTASIEPSSAVDRQPKHGTPVKQESQQRSSASAAPPTVKNALTFNGKEGKDFPEVRTSKIDVNLIPNWPGSGKPITEIDIDADLAEHSKPWRQPGVDQTDFFNYGFDEYTWAQYCMRQQTMANTIDEGKQADAQMKAFLGGAGGPSGGMPGMQGMPDMDPQMAQMMQQAMGNGMPSLDQFMQMMGGGGGGMPNQAGGGGGGFGGGFGMGPGHNSGSPHPQSGQGFQPPSGPAAGMPDNMDGYSPQQIAIMQQGGIGGPGGGGGGGGRRGGRGRGRGFY